MEFSEKLNYLFELTNAEGKALARELSITPPQISKMRKGLRGLPKYPEAARTIAHFFAERCESDIQLNSLSKATRIVQVTEIHDVDLLTDILLDWFEDDSDTDEYAANRATDFLDAFTSSRGKRFDGELLRDSRTLLTPDNATFFTYFGNEGRRTATERLFNHIVQLKKAVTINLLTDETIGWITEDPTFPVQLQTGMMRLVDQGCTFRRIASPIEDIDQAFESLNRWLPLYMAGKATSYYYKRLRDSFNRITIIGAKDLAVLFSFSVGNVPDTDGITFFTTDKDTVNAVLEEFEHYMCMCEPIMKTFNSHSSTNIYDCMIGYEECQENCWQRSNTLSFITLPWDVMTSLKCFDSADERSEFLNYFANRHKIFMRNLSQYTFTDIIRIADIGDIVESKVPISAACMLTGKPYYYTPKEYMLHLKSVLFLLEHEKNYHVIMQRPDDPKSNILYVKDGRRAILAKETEPFTLFEVSEKYLVNSFAEYLRRRIPTINSESIARRLVIDGIKEQIRKIEIYLADD